MNTYNENTYKDLMNLVQKSEAFTFRDYTLDGKVFRIFDYHLASWTLFLEPGALNCRGSMFDITDPENVILKSLPPEKFFNYEEGAVPHHHGKFGDKMDKMDGSLISTYLHNDDLYLKSKGSIFSEQAHDVMRFINNKENLTFKAELLDLVKKGYTINLEYTAPHNRIVIPYQEEALTVLSMREHKTGKTFFASNFIKFLDENGDYPEIKSRMVKFKDLRNENHDHEKFVEDVRNEQEGEGYVVEIVLNDNESYLVKIKNIKYIALHHTKDSVNHPRRLFETIINGASDDLRAMFADDEYVLNAISEMESHVQPIYNHIVSTVEGFVEKNKHLDRKEFAMLAKKEEPKFFGLIMNDYLLHKVSTGEIKVQEKDGKTFGPKPNNYKEFAIKNRKEIFGIGEEPKLDDEGNPLKRSLVNKPD